ncbi:DUF3994 domain-containing protein [Bacillus cereus]|nr:DUF3994 domain-containing protein [Bacillus cereus]MDA2106178.1 DUF3994 domain-containing protein [Bacillus cereus]
MKAKILVTLTLPVMLLAGCTTETYGLTQSEFRQVDKEFKADKMIKDMKQLHYSNEQIEKQLRMALAQLKYEEEMKKKENDKYKGIETEEDAKKDKKKESIGDNETVYEKKVKEKVTVTEERYPYQLYEIYARLQYQIEYLGKGMEKSINERCATVNYTKEESKLVDMQLNYILNLVPIGKYESNYPLLEEGVSKSVSKYRESFEEVEKVFKKTDFSMEADKEVLEKADSKLSEGNRIWIPVFEKLKNETKKVESSSDSSSEDVSSNIVPKSSSPNSSQSDKSQAQTGMFKGIVGTDEELGINGSNTSRYIKNERSIVGKYGIDLGEGVKTILDLKGDMTFAFYKYGDFPSRDSLMKGTYELDVPSLQLTSVTENGHKTQRTESFRYQVLNYDLNMLQLYSADEDVRMRLIKQG